ncbi:LysR substrate-binding domain-containing protein, partial [Streptomyces albidoflavus]
PNLRDAMSSVDRALHSVFEFDPSTTERVFRVALSELGEIGWLPGIVEDFSRTAPHARLEVERLRSDDLVDALRRGTVDLAISPARLDDDLDHRSLKRETYRVAMSAGHPLAATDLSVETYRSARRISVTGDSGAELLEAAHRRLGGVNPPVISVQHFAALPPILARGEFIATIPETLAEGWSVHWPIVTTAVPFDVPVAELHLYRRSTTQHVAALDWFYGTVSRSAARSRGSFSAIGAAP